MLTLLLVIKNICSILHRQGKHHEALDYCQRALVIRKRFLSSDHDDIAHSLIDVAACYESRHGRKMALDCYQQALRIFTTTVSINNPTRIETEDNIRRITGGYSS